MLLLSTATVRQYAIHLGIGAISQNNDTDKGTPIIMEGRILMILFGKQGFEVMGALVVCSFIVKAEGIH